MNTSVFTIIYISVIIPTAECGIAGKFFWKPRLGLHLVPPLPTSRNIKPPTKQNIRDGFVVILEGYSLGVSVIATTAAYQAATKTYQHLSLLHAPFYTNAYRWGMRHFNTIPFWLSGRGSRYPDTHKVWRRRYYYMDDFLPTWTRYLMPWIKNSEWEQERKEYEKYQIVAEPAFSKHFRYPSRQFRDFASEAKDKQSSSIFTVSVQK